MQTYIDSWPLFSLTFGAIGLYLMGVKHGARGLWDRTSTARLLRKTWRRLLGKPVQVLPRHVVTKPNGRAVTIKDRVFVVPR